MADFHEASENTVTRQVRAALIASAVLTIFNAGIAIFSLVLPRFINRPNPTIVNITATADELEVEMEGSLLAMFADISRSNFTSDYGFSDCGKMVGQGKISVTCMPLWSGKFLPTLTQCKIVLLS